VKVCALSGQVSGRLERIVSRPDVCTAFCFELFIATKTRKPLDKGSTDLLKPFDQLNQNHWPFFETRKNRDKQATEISENENQPPMKPTTNQNLQRK
jgi:hypothetical protein